MPPAAFCKRTDAERRERCGSQTQLCVGSNYSNQREIRMPGRWQWLFGMTVLFCGAAVTSDALAYGEDKRSPAVKTFESCLAKAYSEGAYLSTDGGRSAKRLLAKCPSEGDAVTK